MVRISVGSPTHHTSGRLYGVFFEDINHGADGGLNANMVNNFQETVKIYEQGKKYYDGAPV